MVMAKRGNAIMGPDIEGELEDLRAENARLREALLDAFEVCPGWWDRAKALLGEGATMLGERAENQTGEGL